MNNKMIENTNNPRNQYIVTAIILTLIGYATIIGSLLLFLKIGINVNLTINT